MSQRPLDYLFALEQFGIKFGLDNMRALLAGLGHPDRGYRIAHIAGTNGKGSVTAMVEAGLRAAGHRTGRYTSPHLVDLAERFVINGQRVSDEQLSDAAHRIRVVVDTLLAERRLQAQPTFFEATTSMALLLFRQADVDVAVCEVGLGGRLDATNVVTPLVTAITSVGHDHQQYLGGSLAEIAAEKAGIIKTGVPVVVGRLPPEAEAVVLRTAAERDAPAIRVSVDTSVERGTRAGPAGTQQLWVRTRSRDYGLIELPLAGAHQAENATVAIGVLEALDALGIHTPVAAVREGLASTVWPGRLDLRRLPDGREALLDAAHNPEGAQALARFLASEPGGPRALVFGAMRDKDVREMLEVLIPHVRTLVLTRATTSRSADPDVLAQVARDVRAPCPIQVEPDAGAAVELAWHTTPRIVVAGSIFLLGDVMKRQGWS